MDEEQYLGLLKEELEKFGQMTASAPTERIRTARAAGLQELAAGMNSRLEEAESRIDRKKKNI